MKYFRNYKDLLAISVFLLILALGTWKLFNLRMISVPDLPAFPSLSRALFLFNSAWLPLSNSLVFSPIETVLAFRIGLIFLFGGNNVLAQKIYVLLPFFFAFLSSYVFQRKFFSSKYVLFIVSLFYSINPVTIKVFIDMSIGYLYVYAILPLLVLLIHKTMQLPPTFSKKGVQIAFLFSILFAFAFANGLHAILFVVPFCLYYFLVIFFKEKVLRQKLTKVLSLIFLFIPATLPVLVSNFSVTQLFIDYLVAGSTNPSPPVFYSFEGYRNPLVSIATLQTYESTGAFGWGQSWIMILPGLLLLPLIYASLFIAQRERNKPLKSMITFHVILSCAIISFTYLTHIRALVWLFDNYRFLAIFSTPDLPMMLLTFSYSFLLAYTLSRIDRRSFTRAIAVLMIIFALINWPVFTGHLGLNIARSEERETFPNTFSEIPSWFDQTVAQENVLLETDYRTYFPEHFNEILERIENNETTPFRTYWLPFVNSEIEARLQNTEADPFYMPLAMDRFLEVNIAPFLKAIADSISGDLAVNRVGSLLSPVNVKYVIVNLASRSTGPIQVLYEPAVFNVQILGSPEAIVSFLNVQKDLREVYHSTDYVIYENLAYIPRVYAFPTSLIVNSSEHIADEDKVLIQNTLAAVPEFEVENCFVAYSEQLTSEIVDELSAFGATALYFPQNTSSITSGKGTDLVIFPTGFNNEVSLQMENENFKFVVVPLKSSMVPQLRLGGTVLPLNNIEGRNDVFESENVHISDGTNFVLVPTMTELSPVRSGLVWDWDFNEDEIDGRLEGDVDMSDDGLKFDGNGRLLVDDHSVAFSNDSFTLEAWIKMNSTSDEPIFVKGTGSKYSFIVTAGKARFSVSYPSETGELSTTRIDSGLVIRPNKWYHVVAIREAGQYLRVYVNGVSTTIRELGGNVKSEEPLQIGAGMHGSIASIRVYNRTLTEGEILENYESGSTFTDIGGLYFILMMRVETDSASPLNHGYESNQINQSSWGAGSEYHIELSTNGSTPLILSEPYNKDWTACLEDGTELHHFSAFGYVNGFVLEEAGDFKIRLYFEKQVTKNMLIQLWIASWIFLFIGVAVTIADINVIRKLYNRYFLRKH